jgi:serine/threonine protein kinase
MVGFESLLTGRTLADRYRIAEVIGRGGMGAVYRATDERLGREVALKVILLPAGDAHLREHARARFQREARAAARLHHPNVVTVHDFGTDPTLGLDYLVMELLHGEDLASRLERAGPLPVGAALGVVAKAARGLAAGHRAGLVHRDVKPGNLLLTQGDEGPRVHVLDFGIARVEPDEGDATATEFTQAGEAPLSRAYAAPEQLRGVGHASPASDVWALGATMFQLLMGRKPFSETDLNRMAAGHPVPPPPLRAHNPAVPAEVEQLVHRALAWNPAERFADAAVLADALRPVLGAGTDSAPEPTVERTPRKRRMPWKAAAALVTVALLGVGGAELYQRYGAEIDDPRPEPKPRWELVSGQADISCSALFEYCVRVRCTVSNVGDGAGRVSVQASLRGGAEPFRKTERVFLRPKQKETLVIDFPEARLGENYEERCLILRQ